MGHVQDLWYKTVTDPNTGRPIRVKTRLHGSGKRYRVRYLDPDRRERSKSFPDRCKKQADNFLSEIENDKRTGNYINPRAGQIPFETYAETWLASQTFDESTRETVSIRLRKHAYPLLGDRALVTLTPTQIRSWDRELQQRGLAPNHRRVVFGQVQAVLNAAVDDGRLRRNPCNAKSVRKPKGHTRKVAPWPTGRVHAVHAALPERHQLTLVLGAGLGLRQGETLGLAADDIDAIAGNVHITRQVKIIGSKLCFGPPKGGKERDVPLPESVASAINDHTTRWPPRPVTLPWQTPTGPLVTARLVVYGADGGAIRRSRFNVATWHPALRRAGVTSPTRADGFHALRHFYASTLLDAGESIVALAEYLGHHDPAFTLRTYTHLLPSSQQRTPAAIDRVLHLPSDGVHTA